MRLARTTIIALSFIILLSTGACAQQGSGTTPLRPSLWLELPQTDPADSANVYTVVMKIDGVNQRNYSFLWNESRMTSSWVAYPLCRGNMGQGKRSNAFGLCPLLPADKQPLLEKGYRKGNGGWYSRGHQIPSGDRLSYKANVQTFYGINMTPQDEGLNGGVWESLESRARSLALRCDTLYVVTGCTYDGYQGEYVLDNNGRQVDVPTGYYKALLMLSSGEFHGCGYFFENRPYESGSLKRSMMMPLSELERMTGMTFFPNLKKIVGEERYDELKSENPLEQGCWGRN
ncbi:MAG: DNA/RNA non-specific endonuclease [Bacteroidales bacterium]|nr:DNA/RNA non-specific endonuclease [Candidatus Cacconaster equi]